LGKLVSVHFCQIATAVALRFSKNELTPIVLQHIDELEDGISADFRRWTLKKSR
jgi:hypothetical protein